MVTELRQKKLLIVSFSGGETSAFMADWVLKNWSDKYEIIFVFANTGEENEETLEFIDKCDRYFRLNLIWVEAIVNPVMGKGMLAKIVDFRTASRNGEPFEAVIAKYGIPNRTAPHCSKNLKRFVIRAYARSIGWRKYYTAIGIRTDESGRKDGKALQERFLYPLCDEIPTTKIGVNRYWSKMPFRLQLMGYQGNCKWCWKKSLRKHLTIALEAPENFDFPERMEKKYENYIAPTITGRERNITLPQRFFRGNLSVNEIKEMSTRYFEKAQDDSQNTIESQQLILELDKSEGCIESCEI